MNKNNFYVEVERLRAVMVDRGLSAEQLSALLGKPPAFFDDFCRSRDRFYLPDYLSICRALATQPSSHEGTTPEFRHHYTLWRERSH